jgi:hypothetical protein
MSPSFLLWGFSINGQRLARVLRPLKIMGRTLTARKRLLFHVLFDTRVNPIYSSTPMAIGVGKIGQGCHMTKPQVLPFVHRGLMAWIFFISHPYLRRLRLSCNTSAINVEIPPFLFPGKPWVLDGFATVWGVDAGGTQVGQGRGVRVFLTLMNSAESMVSMINLLMQGNIGRI